MALINCPECATEVSSEAPSCPKCGFPVAQKANRAPSKGRFDDAAQAAGIDLSKYEAPGRAPLSEAQVAFLLSQKKKTNHILHLLLSLVTGGLWLIVWLFVADGNRRHNRRIDDQILRI